jgi:hypothetical protein
VSHPTGLAIILFTYPDLTFGVSLRSGRVVLHDARVKITCHAGVKGACHAGDNVDPIPVFVFHGEGC